MNTRITTDAAHGGFIAWLHSFACVKASKSSGWLAGWHCVRRDANTYHLLPGVPS